MPGAQRFLPIQNFSIEGKGGDVGDEEESVGLPEDVGKIRRAAERVGDRGGEVDMV